MPCDRSREHPSITAVRHPNFDFGLIHEIMATCAACGRHGRARPGQRAEAPCGNPDKCAFILVAAEQRDEVASFGWDVAELGGTDGRSTSLRTVPLTILEPPLPPRSSAEWAERRAAAAAIVPELAKAFSGLPIGWFGLVELAAHALDARGLGQIIQHRQSKEKLGTARIYVAPACLDLSAPEFRAAMAVVYWAEELSSFVCARDGTLDGRMRRIGGWRITLGERAWADVLRGDRRRAEVLNFYPDWTAGRA